MALCALSHILLPGTEPTGSYPLTVPETGVRDEGALTGVSVPHVS